MDRENARKYRALLDGGRWFFGLSDSRKEALLSAGSVRKIPAGQQVITQGAPANGLFAVLEGAIRISSPLDSGDEALITVVEPPTWLGEISVLDGEPSPLNGIATTDSLLVHVLQSDLDAILERDPAFWRALGALAMGKLRLTFAAMEDNSARPLADRLAHRLVIMAESHGQWRDRSSRVIEASQEQLARMLSSSRQTVNGLLKTLEAEGVVRLSYGRIEILDLDALKRRAR